MWSLWALVALACFTVIAPEPRSQGKSAELYASALLTTTNARGMQSAIEDSRELKSFSKNTRIRHLRHLEGFTPITSATVLPRTYNLYRGSTVTTTAKVLAYTVTTKVSSLQKRSMDATTIKWSKKPKNKASSKSGSLPVKGSLRTNITSTTEDKARHIVKPTNVTAEVNYKYRDQVYKAKGNAVAKLAVKDNHKPVFADCSSYKPVVKEEAPPGTYVFTVKATDVDPPETGGTVTYKFVTTPGEKERFHIEAHTGKIFTADIFDHDEPSREKETYITVRVTDNGQPSLDDACTIKIIILDINDNPPVFDKVSYSESVPADLLVDREVMRISATDIDDGNNSVVHYELDPSSPDASYFRIDPDTGVIFLMKPIDKFPGYKFRQSAIVKDMGEPPQQSSITLDITVVESNKKSPSFIETPNQVIRLKENHNDFVNPIAVVRAQANTPDNEYVQFELVQGQTEQTNKFHTFILVPDGDTAYVKLGHILDYEKITEYTLTVRIQNNFRLAAETIINIEVEDVNDNIPVFSEIRSGTVLENEPIDTPVMQVRAIDLDGTSAHNQVTYELADPNDPFKIDPITGNITTTAVFDREEKSYYNIKVSAIDNSESALIKGKHNIGQQTFLIEIADKNDNPPRFTQETYIAESIAENANVNELVTQVTAIDVDTVNNHGNNEQSQGTSPVSAASKDKVKFFIVDVKFESFTLSKKNEPSVVNYNVVSGDDFEAFTIKNTGEIRVNKPLDYEKVEEYKLHIRATDGVFEDYCNVIIRIENLNDNPPVFLENYTKTIEEERLYEGCILNLEAYDPDIRNRDAPQNIVFSLVKHEQKEFLDIDNNGCLRLTKPLDRDQPTGLTTWQILIMAADHGGKLGSDSLRSTTEVILELTDINDNAPFLTNTQPVIWFENQPPGQIVILTAKDYDSPENGPPFTFALNDSASFSVKSKFRIEGNVLYSITAFDREETKEYFVPILITDSGAPRMTGLSILHVIIGDKNDNPMGPGFSFVFVYNYKGDSPDTEIGRVYVEDPDDWDIHDKKFTWLPSYDLRSPFFDVNSQTGMITMKQGTPNGTYTLQFNVTEQNEPIVPFHWVEATVNVTVKEIPEEAVDKSGSVRFVNTTAEQFIIPEIDGTSKKEKFHRRLAKLFNVSLDNVDVFTVSNKQTVKDEFLDVRFSAHGSPYYSPEKLNTMVSTIQDELETELTLKIYMVNIDECLIELEQCEDSCRNVLMKSNVPLAVYTNTTSFIGVSARVESECTCEGADQLVCLNGGTPFADKCECAEGYLGPRCERTSIGFHGDGWAMYPAPPPCHEGRLTLTLLAHSSNSLIFYMGPLRKNNLLPVEDFMSLELVDGYPVLLVNYGSGTTKLNNSVVHVSDGKPHLIEIVLARTSIEMFVDRCKLSTCMSLAAPAGNKKILNINGPLQLGGSTIDLKHLSTDFSWRDTPNNSPFVGCIHNLTYNDYMYNLGEPAFHKNADPSCSKSMFTAVTFGIDTNFLVAILVCAAILIILLLAVVVHRRRQDTWAEKELDDIRENIITYDDEGGGEGDAGYDLQVLRQMFGPHPETWKNIIRMRRALLRIQPPVVETVVDCRNVECLADHCFPFISNKIPQPPAAATEEEPVAGNSGTSSTFGTGVVTIPETPGSAGILPPWSFRRDEPVTIVLGNEKITKFPSYESDDEDEITPAPENVQIVAAEVHMSEIATPPSPAPTIGKSENVQIVAAEVHMSEIATPPSPAPTIGKSDFDQLPAEVYQVLASTPPPSPLHTTNDAMTGPDVYSPPTPHRRRKVYFSDDIEEIIIHRNGPDAVAYTPRPSQRKVTFADDIHVVIIPRSGFPEPGPSARAMLSSPADDLTPPSPSPEVYNPAEMNRTAGIRPSWSSFHMRSRSAEFLELANMEDPDIREYDVPAAAPDISGFLEDKKEVLDREPDALNPYDDVRHYAYEGDGETTGSLSSLASCTDDADQNFTYLQEYGPQFSKLADLYGDGGDEIPEPQVMNPQRSNEESWC